MRWIEGIEEGLGDASTGYDFSVYLGCDRYSKGCCNIMNRLSDTRRLALETSGSKSSTGLGRVIQVSDRL